MNITIEVQGRQECCLAVRWLTKWNESAYLTPKRYEENKQTHNNEGD